MWREPRVFTEYGDRRGGQMDYTPRHRPGKSSLRILEIRALDAVKMREFERLRRADNSVLRAFGKSDCRGTSLPIEAIVPL